MREETAREVLADGGDAEVTTAEENMTDGVETTTPEDHFDDCLVCGGEFDTAIQLGGKFQVKNGQVCLHRNSEWAFLHRIGGGARE